MLLKGDEVLLNGSVPDCLTFTPLMPVNGLGAEICHLDWGGAACQYEEQRGDHATEKNNIEVQKK